jgi:undecaprenyl diphosphate synthase
MNAPQASPTQSPSSAALEKLGLPAQALPRHIAIIMDGNGRWAQQRGQPRFVGHQKGAETVRGIVTHCAQLGIEALTLYSFSVENWKRPQAEIDFLMQLYIEYLRLERQTMMENNVRFRQVGRREGLPQPVLDELDLTAEMTKNHTGLTLALAINYGSRAELTDAMRAIACKVQTGHLQPEDITEDLISSHLFTAGLPDPDLLIRTAGEMRVSNYLLWQISYAEFYVTKVLWPDFDVEQLNLAIKDYACRTRKFGAVIEPQS